MVRDTALVPSEAIRLAALGILAHGPKRYAELAAEVRYFIGHITGPSLDLMGSSLELLRHEGLIEALGDGDGDGGGGLRTHTNPDAEVAITSHGRREMEDLLRAPIRGPINDLNKLIIALKMQFLHMLDSSERRAQINMLIEICEGELARLRELREHHRHEVGSFIEWIDHDIGQILRRLDWFRAFRERV
jgi:DNA-binding PadR family transcriptional regulator